MNLNKYEVYFAVSKVPKPIVIKNNCRTQLEDERYEERKAAALKKAVG